MPNVPNTNTFSLQDVVDVVPGSQGSLQDCFDDASDVCFCEPFKGSKDRLSNFRFYGPQGNITGVQTDDNTGYYWGMDGNIDWWFITSGDQGLRRYLVDAVGNMTLQQTYAPIKGGSYLDVSLSGSPILVTELHYPTSRYWMHLYTQSGITVTYRASVDVSFYGGAQEMNVLQLGINGFSYVTARDAGTTFGIKVYKTEAFVTYSITHQITYISDSALYWEGVIFHANSTWLLIMGGDNGTTSFDINISNGYITKNNIENTGSYIGYCVLAKSETWIVTLSSKGIILYTIDGSNDLVWEDSLDTGFTLFHGYIHESGIIYAYSTTGTIRRYIVQEETMTLFYIGETIVNDLTKAYIWNNAPNVLLVSRGDEGVTSQLIDTSCP